MKRKIFWLTAICTLLLVFGCSEKGIVGDDFLGDDKIRVSTLFINNLVPDLQYYSENDVSAVQWGLLGSYNDPDFGSSQAGMAFHLRLTANPNFADTIVLDSIKLFLNYSNYYGDTSSMQKASVYELIGDISFSENYTVDFDINPLLGDKLGEKSFSRKNIYDSVFLKTAADPTVDSLDTSGKKIFKEMINQLVITLDNSYGQKIMSGDPSFFESGEAFISFIKGLCVLSEPVASSEKGCIYAFDLFSSSTFVALYSHYITADDTINKINTFPITENSARINLFEHDNSGTQYEGVLNGSLTTDTTLYLQGMSGSKIFFEIPGLNTWADSADIIINQAELRFDVIGDSVYRGEFPIPFRLQLDALNENEDEYNITSETLSLLNVDIATNFDYTNNQYVFLLPLYMQTIVNGENVNTGFNLYPYSTEMSQRRVLLYDNKDQQHIQLKITYTKTK